MFERWRRPPRAPVDPWAESSRCSSPTDSTMSRTTSSGMRSATRRRRCARFEWPSARSTSRRARRRSRSAGVLDDLELRRRRRDADGARSGRRIGVGPDRRGQRTSRTSLPRSTGCSGPVTCSSTSARTSATTRSGPRRGRRRRPGRGGRSEPGERPTDRAHDRGQLADERRVGAPGAGCVVGGYVNFGTHVGSNGGFLPDDAGTTGSGRGTIVPTSRSTTSTSTVCR